MDFGGFLLLPDQREWSKLGLVGNVFELAYDVDSTKTATLHIGDAAFLRTWRIQPNFHMIK